MKTIKVDIDLSEIRIEATGRFLVDPHYGAEEYNGELISPVSLEDVRYKVWKLPEETRLYNYDLDSEDARYVYASLFEEYESQVHSE